MRGTNNINLNIYWVGISLDWTKLKETYRLNWLIMTTNLLQWNLSRRGVLLLTSSALVQLCLNSTHHWVYETYEVYPAVYMRKDYQLAALITKHWIKTHYRPFFRLSCIYLLIALMYNITCGKLGSKNLYRSTDVKINVVHEDGSDY